MAAEKQKKTQTVVDKIVEKTTKGVGYNGNGKPFPPGNRMSPGRPVKGTSLSECIREYLDGTIDTENGTITRRQALAKAVYARAMKGGDAAQGKIVDIDDKGKKYSKDENEREAILYRIYKRLSPVQRVVIDQLEHGAKYIINEWGRRTGKTELNAHLPAYCAAKWPNAEVVYVHLTARNAIEQCAHLVKNVMNLVGIRNEYNASKGIIEHGEEGKVYFVGNDSKDEREKMRGYGKNRRMIIIDECQSQKELKYLEREILMPTQVDCDATIVMNGTRVRVRGDYWEEIYTTPREGKYINFANMFDNPFIKNHMQVLQRMLDERGLSIDDPFVRREFFNEDAYDDDALVLRFTEKNYYTPEQLAEWEKKQPSGDIFAIVGVDIGHDDSDSVFGMIASKSDNTIWGVCEEAIPKQGIEDLANMIMRSLAGIMQSRILYEQPIVVIDTGGLGKKIAYELVNKHKIPMQAAIKHDREASIRIAKDRTKNATLRIVKDGLLDKDCKKIIHVRNDKDQITGEIDDAFHSDIFDSLIYALRFVNNRVGQLQ